MSISFGKLSDHCSVITNSNGCNHRENLIREATWCKESRAKCAPLVQSYLWSESAIQGDQRPQRSPFLRSVPSPLQGTSHSMRSYWRTSSAGTSAGRGGNALGDDEAGVGAGAGAGADEAQSRGRRTFGKTVASWLSTTQSGDCRRFTWCIIRWQRLYSKSFAITIPAACESENVRSTVQNSVHMGY